MPSSTSLSLADIQDGDRVEVCFDPPVREPEFGEIEHAHGIVRTMIGKFYLMAESHRKAWQMGAVIDLEEDKIKTLHILETSVEQQTRRHEQARGEVVFKHLPRTAREVEDQLLTLAEMMTAEEDKTSLRSRYTQLKFQFNDIADHVALAGTKRNYLLAKVRLNQDVNPWLWSDDRVYRNETVRPLPADFELDVKRRKDRQVRLDQSIRIFGEVEREVRIIASRLRKMGYEVRRPHPNAQQLLIKFPQIKGKAEVKVLCSGNGRWRIEEHPSSNKSEAKAMARLRRSGLISQVRIDLDRALEDGFMPAM